MRDPRCRVRPTPHMSEGANGEEVGISRAAEIVTDRPHLSWEHCDGNISFFSFDQLSLCRPQKGSTIWNR